MARCPLRRYKRRSSGCAATPRPAGEHLADSPERKSFSVAEDMELFGVESANLADAIEERAPVAAGLAVRMQAAGGARAVVWMRLQVA